ncbi:MFS transporter [Cellulomonas sp. C5510]|uniref:MFS transporter n=1 Tax=Cellulomonas sp. C5510 TaxID=2871170 RepID=UPI001C98D2DC|nr:MFS transporter [Cellulomonas sp. C5510]QZN87007.1 MFS transporter [Cellulomonas sp. C5510]
MFSTRSAGTRSAGFWVVVLAATANYTVLSASAPLLSRAVPDVLGGDEALAGTLVSITGLTGAACMTLVGIATSRYGPRAVTLVSAAVAVLGVGALVALFTVPGVVAGRVVYGIGNAGITVATTAWVSVTAPAGTRGRALGYYGISVWVGLALGPVLGENLYAASGNAATWAGLLAVQGVALVAAASVAAPPRPAPPAPPVPLRVAASAASAASAVPAVPAASAASAVPAVPAATGPGRARAVVAVVRAPALVALCAWGAQGVFTTFLVQHLQSRGVPAAGVLGASSIFLVFAAAVVAARFALGSLPDRLGPVTTTRGALVAVAAGLAGMAVADSFWTAAAAAVLLGVGYAPLYPSLTLLSTAALPDPLRPPAIGVFSAATSLGMAAGAFGGGVLIAAAGSVTALACGAVLQLLVLPAVRAPRLPAGAGAGARPVPAVDAR